MTRMGARVREEVRGVTAYRSSPTRVKRDRARVRGSNAEDWSSRLGLIGLGSEARTRKTGARDSGSSAGTYCTYSGTKIRFLVLFSIPAVVTAVYDTGTKASNTHEVERQSTTYMLRPSFLPRPMLPLCLQCQLRL